MSAGCSSGAVNRNVQGGLGVQDEGTDLQSCACGTGIPGSSKNFQYLVPVRRSSIWVWRCWCPGWVQLSREERVVWSETWLSVEGASSGGTRFPLNMMTDCPGRGAHPDGKLVEQGCEMGCPTCNGCPEMRPKSEWPWIGPALFWRNFLRVYSTIISGTPNSLAGAW